MLFRPGKLIARWINRGAQAVDNCATRRCPGHWQRGLTSISGHFRGARFARSRPVRSLILAALLLAFAVTISTVILLSVLRDRAILASKYELETISSVLAEQSSAAFQSLELVQTSVIERIQALGITSSELYEQRMSDYATHLMLKDKIVSLPHVG